MDTTSVFPVVLHTQLPLKPNLVVPEFSATPQDKLDEAINCGRSLGFDMEGCEGDMEKLITGIGVHRGVNFLGIQETKMCHVDLVTIRTVWGNSRFDFACSLARGLSGGILCVWDPTMFVKSRIVSHDHFVAVEGNWCNGNCANFSGESILMGDFNVVRAQDERLGSIFNTSLANDFNEFILDTELIDLPLGGYQFTWVNSTALKMRKINRPDDLVTRRGFIKDLAIITKAENMDLAQRAKIRWGIEGDKNSKYFHSSINRKRRQLAIRGVLVNGTWETDPRMVKRLKINLMKCKLMGVGVSTTEVQHMAATIGTPITIIDTLETIRNKFFWGMEIGEKKITWIKWKKSMARKEDGGLGIGSLYGFNRALRYKWKWQFRTAPDALWVKIIKSLFGHDGGLLAYKYTGNSNSIWVNILKASKELESKNVGLDALVKKQIGDGGYKILGRHCWIGELWVWAGDGTGVFTVASERSIIDTRFLVIDSTPTRWSKDVPIKINVFIWKLLFDKLPTHDNLEKKGLDVPSTLCGICDDVTETASHIFVRCEFALEIWREIARWWDLDIPHMSSMKELLGWVGNLKISKTQKKGLYNVVITAAWSIWGFQNETVFGVEKPKKALIFDPIVSQAFFWMSNRNKKLRCN
ncbi:RNA-directed DNA polymerase, eukaryota [Tanacetum coccineum]|uniref:RNA-directed DNA polymerase, eukaryota n=1 Tax=Tanacetum coccineum TaxID=301880 RepID=A0ABQ5J7U8_9ASTR